jgi:hypothetical protein
VEAEVRERKNLYYKIKLFKKISMYLIYPMVQTEHSSKKRRFFSRLSDTLKAIEKTGLRINPYYIFLEGLFSARLREFEKEFEGYEIALLGQQDMSAISSANISDRKESEEYLLNRLKRGPKCIGVRYRAKIVAFTWYDLKQCNFYGMISPLRASEVFLFDAYTLKSHRGKGIAPFVRWQVYKMLSQSGSDILFSVSDFFNTSAIRFKKKLDARLLELRLSVQFRSLHLDVRLKRYGKQISRFKTLYLSCWIKGHRLVETNTS